MDTVASQLEVNCPKCGMGVTGELTPDMTHYAKAKCVCGNFWWIAKPEDEPTKYKRPKSSTGLAKKDYCEMCLKPREELPKRVVLHGHHIVEHQDGGSDEDDNLWTVCTACHRLIHWARTYTGAAS